MDAALPVIAFLACWLAAWRYAARKRIAALGPALVAQLRPMPRTTPECIDFTIIESSPAHSRIRWKNGRLELVSPDRLKTLKKSFLWKADFPTSGS